MGCIWMAEEWFVLPRKYETNLVRHSRPGMSGVVVGLSLGNRAPMERFGGGIELSSGCLRAISCTLWCYI